MRNPIDVLEVHPEDRVADRKVLSAEARLEVAGGDASTNGVVTDLSVHGLWIAVERPLERGSRTRVSFDAGAGRGRLSLDAVVARVGQHAGDEAEMGMGLAFVNVRPNVRRELDAVVAVLPPRVRSAADPVIAAVEYDSLEDEVEEILDDEDVEVIEASGLFAIPADDGSDDFDDDFDDLEDDELELISLF